MAEDPIIIDDGGSTRIKKHHLEEGIGEMNKLLDVKKPKEPPDARAFSQDETVARKRPYGESLTIACIDTAGNPFNPEGFKAVPFKTFKIVSGSHEVDGSLLFRGDRIEGGTETVKEDQIRLKVSGPRGNPPVVDAKQHDGRRRYIVTNSQRISSVSVEPVQGDPPPPFDATAKSPAGLDIVYTTVVVN